MNSIARYFAELAQRFGSGWNRFWFTPADPYPACVLRIATGLLTLWYLIGFTADLVTWFGPDGLLPVEMVYQLTADPEELWNGRASHLYYLTEPTLLWAAHGLAIAVAAAYTVGFLSRVTNILTLAIVLAYVHRGPIIVGQFEPVLTMLLFYLCLAPTGRYLSLDAWMKQRRPDARTETRGLAERSVAAGIAIRLMQLHIAAFYLITGLTMLGGTDTWFAGEAMWWLIAQSESRLVDLTFLYEGDYLINVWTHAVVIFQLLYATLIWNRLARPLLMAVTIVHWLLIGLILGLLTYAAVMIVANLAFVSPSLLRQFFERREPGLGGLQAA